MLNEDHFFVKRKGLDPTRGMDGSNGRLTDAGSLNPLRKSGVGIMRDPGFWMERIESHLSAVRMRMDDGSEIMVRGTASDGSHPGSSKTVAWPIFKGTPLNSKVDPGQDRNARM